MEIIKPPRLNKGDTIGVVSPSLPITDDLKSQLERGVETLESHGFHVKFARHAFAKLGYAAGTPEQRVSDFRELLQDEQVKMILFSQGGCAANQILDRFDYSAIRKNPKIVSGIPMARLC